LIKSSWKKDGSCFYQEVVVPVNTKATVYVYASDKENVKVNGKRLSEYDFLKIIGQENDYVKVEVGSGEYNFISQIK